MLQLILIIFIILIIIAIICMDFHNVEGFKDKVDNTSINVLIDVTIKILTIKSILDETKAKLDYNIIMLNETYGIHNEMNSDNKQVEILNNKIIEIEKYRNSIDNKIQKIDKIKDKVYNKLPKILIEKLNESVEITMRHKAIYKEIVEITSNNKFDINPELLKLEKYSKDLQKVLIDVMTKF